MKKNLIKNSTNYAFDRKSGELRNAAHGKYINIPEHGVLMVLDGNELKEFQITFDELKHRYTSRAPS